MTADDGHGPRYGCGWQKCGNPSAETPCPFIKSTFVEVRHKVAPTECKHEWRQLDGWMSTKSQYFYCIHCLETKKLFITQF